MKVIKRDGTPQEYSFLKIVDAINKAFESVGQDVPDKFLEILDKYKCHEDQFMTFIDNINIVANIFHIIYGIIQ